MASTKKNKPKKINVKLYDDIVQTLNIDYNHINKGDIFKIDFENITFKNEKSFTLLSKNKWKTELTDDEIKNKKIKYVEEIFDEETNTTKDECKELKITVKNGYGSFNVPDEWEYYVISILESPLFDKSLEKLNQRKIKKFEDSGIIVKSISNIDDLLKEIKIYESKTTADYHPFSKKMIRDVVHPSLYPYIDKVSKLKNKINKEKEIKKDFWNRPYEKSKFQWLPSEFLIENGKCKIDSYINNLPVSEINIYNGIQKLFNSLIPEFEKMWAYIKNMKLYNEDDSAVDLNVGNSTKKVSIKPFKNLQVIVKIVTISVKDNLEGAWHVEGMSHENIVMTAVAVLEQEGVDATLNFKRRFTENEAYYLYWNLPQDRPSYVNNFINEGLLPLGKLSTQAGKAILFPNSHVHKLDLESNGKNTRRIVVFWVINPDKRIISTKDVDVQQKIISKSSAKKYRLELMNERKYHKQNFNVREINLCEH